jgi:acetyl esterase/lipase
MEVHHSVLKDSVGEHVCAEIFSPNGGSCSDAGGLPVIFMIHGGGLLDFSRSRALYEAKKVSQNLAKTGKFVVVVPHYQTTSLPIRVVIVFFFALGVLLSIGWGMIFGFTPNFQIFLGLYALFCGILTLIYLLRNNETKHPEHVQSAAESIELVQQKIGRYGGNPNALIFCGHSSGGFICAHLSLNPHTWFKNCQTRDAILGCILLSAVGDLLPLSQAPWVSQFLGPVLLERQCLKPEHSPIRQPLNPSNEIPFLVLQSETEFFNIPFANAIAEKVLGTKMWMDNLREQKVFTGVVQGNHFTAVLELPGFLMEQGTFWGCVLKGG